MAGGDAEQLPASLWSNIRDLSPDSSDQHKNKNDDCPSGSAHHMALGLARLVYVLPINNSILQSPRSSSPSWCSLSALQITENNLFSFERARVEHVSCLYGNVSSVIKFVTTCAHFLGMLNAAVCSRAVDTEEISLFLVYL